MKKDIHPKYNDNVPVKCACGNSWTTGSILESIDLEICNKCHPFYTGKEKYVDTRGRLEKFAKRVEKHQEKQKEKTTKKPRIKKQEAKPKATRKAPSKKVPTKNTKQKSASEKKTGTKK